MTEPAKRSLIRSFVRREGRITTAQQRALNELWPRFGIDFSPTLLDLNALFGRSAPRTLEIGFGNGESLLDLARTHPDLDYLGIEVHRPGIGHLLQQLETLSIDNVRVICADAVEVLEKQLPAACLDRIQIFFPDPWPKKRHHKRRLIQPAFVALLIQKLKPGGLLHLATDWEHYAEQMLMVLDTVQELINTQPGGGYAPRPRQRPLTKFERRGELLGHNVRDLIYRHR